MSDVQAFITRADAYCRSRGVASSTLSRKLLGNGKRLDELKSGKSLRMDTFARATELLDEMENAPVELARAS